MKLHQDVMGSFDIYGDFSGAVPYGTGHINHTFKATFSQAGKEVHYLFQKINRSVFRNPEALMENISRICDHLAWRARESGMEDASRRVLNLVRTKEGAPWYRDTEDEYWRCYFFVEGATGHDVVQNHVQAHEAARCFGEYLNLLADLPGERLHDTIPDFHNTPDRLARLKDAAREDPLGLAGSVAPELDFFLEREPDLGLLMDLQASGDIPERVTHNDTKLNNVLIDDITHKGVCVIDFDTSMPGLSLYDFGDLVRTSTSPVPEDHQQADEVRMDAGMYRALVEGFMEGGGAFLNEMEIRNLPEGGRLMTLEVGMRFLTDYLMGSPYFRTAYPEHNLVRCRTQIGLAASIEEQMPMMKDLSESLLPGRN